MRTVKQYILEEMGIEMPKGEIPESWFKENNLPKEIYCVCCGVKMELQSAMVEDGGLVFCKKCEKSLESFRPSSISLQGKIWKLFKKGVDNFNPLCYNKV